MAMHIIKALKHRRHVVLESPTGTGKSAAILCAVLAWQRWHHKTFASSLTNSLTLDHQEVTPSKPPTIIYCSRTHSQVTQMIASLRKTPYRPRMAVLGSRQRLCIHATVKNPKKNLQINQECRTRVSNTEQYRKKILNSPNNNNYNDENPPVGLHQDSLEKAQEADIDMDSDRIEPPSNKPMCSHYRQLGPSRTSQLAYQTFVPAPNQVNNNCDCGGEQTKLGTHDMEDLVKFGQNPYKQRNVAVYRRDAAHKFGMTIAPDQQGRMRVMEVATCGAAAKEGTIKKNDEIVSIHGKTTIGKTLGTVCTEIGESPNPLIMDITSHPDQVMRDNELSPHAPCPYFLSRALAKHAELIFCPYNYVLDPFIRKSLDIQLEETIVVLDEAHNVEDVLRDSGTGKFGEIELCEMIVMLSFFASADKNSSKVADLSMESGIEKADVSVMAHDLLLFVEKLVHFLVTEKIQFEQSPKADKAIADWIKFKTPDDQEFEMTFDGPTGHGTGGKTIGCQRFFDKVALNASQADHYRKLGDGLETHIRQKQGREYDKFAAIMDKLNNLIMIVSYALEQPEHYFIASVAQANGSLEFASGTSEEGARRESRNQRQPKKLPLVWPWGKDNCNSSLLACFHPQCRNMKTGPNFLEGAIRHGNYCNGSTQPWEAYLVVNLLTPSLFMKDLRDRCRSVILASGSLAPLPSLCAELGLEGQPNDLSKPTESAAYKDNTKVETEGAAKSALAALKGKRLQVAPKPLEANHIIDLEKQLLAVSIGFFPDGSPLTVNFKNQSQSSFIPKLGDAIASCIEAIPTGGVLVFLPSYKTLNACVKKWGGSPRRNQGSGYSDWNHLVEGSDVWNRLVASKGKVIVEPTGSQDQFEVARDEYAEAIKCTGKCILIAVFRGKMSEGISFNDANARGVICVGIPFPNAFDRAITAKKKYNDEQRIINKKHDILPGDQWYLQQAYRAIAQALGRCIRHAADYGTIILMDSRHCDDGSPVDGVCLAQRNLPKWMRHHVRNLSSRRGGDPSAKSIPGGWPGLHREMTSFFRQAPINATAIIAKQKDDLKHAQTKNGEVPMFNFTTGQWSSPSACSIPQLPLIRHSVTGTIIAPSLSGLDIP